MFNLFYPFTTVKIVFITVSQQSFNCMTDDFKTFHHDALKTA